MTHRTIDLEEMVNKNMGPAMSYGAPKLWPTWLAEQLSAQKHNRRS
jgi:hypothetical protein